MTAATLTPPADLADLVDAAGIQTGATPEIDRSWRSGTGRALGTAGCVLAARDAEGTLWRLSLPLQRVTFVSLRIRPASADRVQTLTGSAHPVEEVLSAGLAAAGLSGVEVSGTARDDLWNAAALGGGPAAAAAALRALSAASGNSLTEARIAALLAGAGLDPAAAYGTATLLDMTSGAAADLDVPRFTVVTFAPRTAEGPGVPVAPLPQGGPAELAELHEALPCGAAAVAAVATAQARKVTGDPVLTTALQMLDDEDVPGLLGVLSGGAHGTVGFLFAGDDDGGRAARGSLWDLLLPAAPGYGMALGLTPGR